MQPVTEILQIHRHLFGPVVKFDPATDKLRQLDFTAANTSLTPDILNNTSSFCDYVDEQLKQAGALYGIGGYNEHRTVYSISKVFDADVPGEEPRRLHLGVDIWGDAGTIVMAPADGVVHSFAFNNRLGDYGGTIILSHSIAGTDFFTLYGHLGLDSIRDLQEGKHIRKGEIFARLGVPEENGQWPPHLHFQIILSIGSWKGDYPGVCRFSDRESWLANSPDPDIIIQMNRYL